MASGFYLPGKKRLWNGSIDLDTDTLKLALTTSSYTPNLDTHDFFDDVTNELANGNGYTSGGFTLASITLTEDTANDRVVFDAADVSQSNFTGTYRYGIIYKSTGTASTSPLIALIDFTNDRTLSAETLLIQFNSSGIFYY